MIEKPLPPPRLLLVDDSPSNLAILSSALAQYPLYTATDGLQALEIAHRELPDLILLDIRMPGMDGYETCSQLKQQAKTQHIPVIFVTGLDDEEDETLGFALGAVDYITKPIRPNILRMRVAAQLQLKARRDQLEQMADTDVLTCLANRRHFEVVMQKEWNRALRFSTPLNLVMVDVDYFKQFNDCYGHVAGDECLKAIACSLNASLRRAGDMVARWGGEEFVCLLPGMTKPQAADLAESILQRIRDLNVAHAKSIVADYVTVSLGLAALDLSQHQSWRQLLECADQALYNAKAQGRNQLVVL